jgi:hypothetical protein
MKSGLSWWPGHETIHRVDEMIEAVTAILGLICACIFIAHAVDAYLAPYGPAGIRSGPIDSIINGGGAAMSDQDDWDFARQGGRALRLVSCDFRSWHF